MLSLQNLRLEKNHGHPLRRVIGIDEVGRGCLAGPVVVCAVWVPPSLILDQGLALEVQDSKKIPPAKRKILYDWLCASVEYRIVWKTPEEIDELNILQATLVAMGEAAETLGFDHALVDGNKVPRAIQQKSTAVIGGDNEVFSIACASILAKVYRDTWMLKYEEEFPGYGFSQHKGYPTVLHKNALKQLGPTQIHRRSFTW